MTEHDCNEFIFVIKVCFLKKNVIILSLFTTPSRISNWEFYDKPEKQKKNNYTNITPPGVQRNKLYNAQSFGDTEKYQLLKKSQREGVVYDADPRETTTWDEDSEIDDVGSGLVTAKSIRLPVTRYNDLVEVKRLEQFDHIP